jgi:hypothetical protein
MGKFFDRINKIYRIREGKGGIEFLDGIGGIYKIGKGRGRLEGIYGITEFFKLTKFGKEEGQISRFFRLLNCEEMRLMRRIGRMGRKPY